MSDSGCSGDVLLNRLAEEFAARYRRGERPPLREYVEKYPELADDIRDLFPALVGMERVKEDGQEIDTPVGVLPPLQELGDYRIIREIGHGGMGVVYEAEQLSLGRHVALKILPQSLLRETKQRRRFEREVRAAAKLHHTNIVPVFGVGDHDGMPYYAMQFIQGLGLDEVIEELKRMQPGGHSGDGPPVPVGNELRAAHKDISAAEVARSLINGKFQPGPEPAGEDAAAFRPAPAPAEVRVSSSAPQTAAGRLSDAFELSASSGILCGRREDTPGGARKLSYWQSVARVGVQVAAALEYAHQQGILHRDIKPSNLLLDTRGTVWVTDFGLAKVEDQENLTDTGDVLGTLRYMPPEAFDGQSDTRGDVYSLGLTLYELLVLRPAFVEKERSKLIKLVTTGEPPRLERLNRAIPRDLVTIVHKALEHDAGHRYPTAGELAADLQRFLDDVPIKVRRASALEQLARWARRHKGVAAALGVITFLLVAFAVGAGVTAGRLGQLADERKAALDQELEARKEERWQRYRANIATAASALELNNLNVMRGALEDAPEEYRGCWEWRYFHSQLDSARTVVRPRGAGGKLEPLTLSPTGNQIAAWDESAKLVRLWDAMTDTETAALPGHEDRVTLLAYSPDSKQLASAGDRGSIRLWEVETGRPLALLCKETTPVDWRGLAYSPDGRRLAAWDARAYRLWDTARGEEVAILSKEAGNFEARFSPDGRRLVVARGKDVCLFEAATGRQIVVMTGHERTVGSLAFSPDGQRIASGAHNSVRLWDGVTGKEVAILRGHTTWPRALVFSPDGSRLASGGVYPDNTVCLWQASDGRPIAIGAGHKNEIRSLAFSPDGQRLVSSSADHTARLWDGGTGQAIAVLRGHNEQLKSADFSPDGTRILSSDGKELRLWEARTGELIAVLRGHDAGLENAAFTSGGARVVSIANGILRIWDAELAEQSGILRDHTSFVYDVAFSPDGKRLASAAWDHAVRLWDLTKGQSADPLRHEDYRVAAVAFCPDGHQLAAITLDAHLHLWNMADASRRHVLEMQKERYWLVPPRPAYHPQGTLVAAVRGDDRIGLWDPVTGALVDELRGPACKPCDLAFRPDGAQLAAGGEDGLVHVWDVARRVLVAELRGHSNMVYRLAYSPNGRLLASGSSDRTVRLWDARTYQELAMLQCGGYAYGLAFSPDGTRLAVGCSDNTIRLFDLATRQQVAELRGHTDYVHAVAFSPDGTRLASASGDLTVRLWDTLPASERARTTQP